MPAKLKHSNLGALRRPIEPHQGLVDLHDLFGSEPCHSGLGTAKRFRMFALFILPFAVRNDPMTYEWVFYRALGSLEALMLIAPPWYFDGIDKRENSDSWATLATTQVTHKYELPTQNHMERVERVVIEESALTRIKAQYPSPNKIWAETLGKEIPELRSSINIALMTARTRPRAVILWANCPSVSAAARNQEIPVIHNELGPLRSPWFKPTAYFDLNGVNGNTSSLERWETFRKSAEGVPVLSRKRLLEVLGARQEGRTSRSRRRDGSVDRRYRAGVALQVPTDSNLIAFGNGNSNLDAILTAQRYFGDVLVRPHPSMPEKHHSLTVDWDESDDPADFLSKIDHLVTVNSSLALEAMLRGIPTTILGQSPFAWGANTEAAPQNNKNSREHLLWLNWIVFGYLIPEDFLFNNSYYNWRLSLDATEHSIYIKNFLFWTRCVEGPDNV